MNCVHILEFCYGPSPSSETSRPRSSPPPNIHPNGKGISEWQVLLKYTQDWQDAKPFEFEPIFTGPATHTSTFPILHYHLPIHAAAAMYFHACMILLILHKPAVEVNMHTGSTGFRLNSMCERASEPLDEDIRSHVRALCGMALGNSHMSPVMTVACTVVALCSHYFCNSDEVDKKEMMALLGVLEESERLHGWPTSLSRQHIKALWGWDHNTFS